MTTFERKINVCLNYIVADNEDDRRRAVEEAKELLAETKNAPPSALIDSKMIRRKVEELLNEIGIPCHLKGYRCTVGAVMYSLDNPTALHAITTELYPAVAKQFNTTASRVERAIRHTVEVAFNNSNIEFIYGLFGNSISANKGKPTNGHFINALAKEIKRQIGED